MTDEKTSIAELRELVQQFVDQRDWQQFHSPKNLSMALAIEAAELQELMLWKSDSQVADDLSDGEHTEKFKDEIGDVLIYTLLLAHAGHIDPLAAIKDKLAKNAQKYPIDRAKGSAAKYTDL